MGLSLKKLAPIALGGLVGGPMGAGIGAGIGLLGGLVGGSDKTAVNVSRTDPNPYVAQYLPGYLSRADELSKSPYQAFTGQRVAGLSPYQTSGIGLLGNINARNNPLYNIGSTALQETIAGKYMPDQTYNNPYLKGTIDKALGDVRGMMGSTFTGDNFGSSAHQELMSKRGMEAITPILMEDYQRQMEMQRQSRESERNRQMQAIMATPGMAQSMSQAGMLDASALLQGGALEQQQNQNEIDAQLAAYEDQRNWPRENLGLLSQALNVAGGVGGGTTTQTGPNPYAKNKLASGLGAAATTGGLLNMAGMMGSPWAMPAIAGMGLLGAMG